MTELRTHVGTGLSWDDTTKLINNPNVGDVAGPGASNDNRAVRFDGGTGKLIQDSSVTIDDAGNISTPGTVDGVDVSVLGANAVAGPGSATDNAVTRFDGTTGKLVQNSAATIDDSGNITAGTLNGVSITTLSAFMPQLRVLSSNVNSTSTTVATVSALTFSSIPAGTYVFLYAFIVSTAASTTGYKTHQTFSGTSTTYVYGVNYPISDGLTSALNGVAFGGNTLADNPHTGSLTASSTGVLALFTGSIVATTSGNLAIQFATMVAGSAATMLAGTYGLLLRVS